MLGIAPTEKTIIVLQSLQYKEIILKRKEREKKRKGKRGELGEKGEKGKKRKKKKKENSFQSAIQSA